jgi:hypothetical protein
MVAREQETRTIPSAFIRPDSDLSNSDKYINVHDIQMLRGNANILYARRFRQNLICQELRDDLNSRQPARSAGIGPFMSEFRFGSNLLYKTFFHISPGTRSLTVNLLGSHGNASGGNIKIFPVLRPHGVHVEVDNGAYLEYTSTTAAWDTIEIPVPATPRRSPVPSQFMLYGSGKVYGADLKALGNVVEAGEDWVLATIEQTVGSVCYFPSNYDIAPRVVQSARPHASGYMHTIEGTFNIVPTNADTINCKAVQECLLHSLNVHENGISDFDTEPVEGV